MHASPGAVPEVDYSQGDAVNINALYLHSIPLETAAVASTTTVTTINIFFFIIITTII